MYNTVLLPMVSLSSFFLSVFVSAFMQVSMPCPNTFIEMYVPLLWLSRPYVFEIMSQYITQDGLKVNVYMIIFLKDVIFEGTFLLTCYDYKFSLSWLPFCNSKLLNRYLYRSSFIIYNMLPMYSWIVVSTSKFFSW